MQNLGISRAAPSLDICTPPFLFPKIEKVFFFILSFLIQERSKAGFVSQLGFLTKGAAQNFWAVMLGEFPHPKFLDL